jgi:hypothetical protein
MRQAHNARRSRGRSNRKHNVPLKHQSFESNGPDVRIRGNAHQVYEKYLAMARDAHSAGNRISAEGYFQHAEHYFRIMNDSTDPQSAQRQQQQRQRENGHDRQGPDGGQRVEPSDATEAADPAKAAEGSEPVKAADAAEPIQTADPVERAEASDAEPAPAAEASPAAAEAAVNGAEVHGEAERPAPKRRRRAPKAAKPDDGEAAKDDSDTPPLPGV